MYKLVLFGAAVTLGIAIVYAQVDTSPPNVIDTSKNYFEQLFYLLVNLWLIF